MILSCRHETSWCSRTLTLRAKSISCQQCFWKPRRKFLRSSANLMRTPGCSSVGVSCSLVPPNTCAAASPPCWKHKAFLSQSCAQSSWIQVVFKIDQLPRALMTHRWCIVALSFFLENIPGLSLPIRWPMKSLGCTKLKKTLLKKNSSISLWSSQF